MQAKITFAGTTARSFGEAETMMQMLADRTVSAKQVERVTERIGAERVAERDAETAQYEQLPLVERKEAPATGTPPGLGVVMLDGGRLQLRHEEAACADAEVEADEEPLRGHWREDQIGLILSMESLAGTTDPCPRFRRRSWIGGTLCP